MYALERKIQLEIGHCPRYCWTRYAVSANRPLLEKVRAGQPKPNNWRVVTAACAVEEGKQNFVQTA